MIGYAMLGTNDLARARKFYQPLMELLGGKEHPAPAPHRRTFYAKAGGPPMLAITEPVDGEPATVGNGSMLALPLASRRDVDALYAKALELGGADEGAPGVRGEGEPAFYAAYFRDPDGNKLCVYRRGAA